VVCVDPALNTAEKLRAILTENRLLNRLGAGDSPQYEFYVSDYAVRLSEFADRIMPFPIDEIKKIDIESF
jgi:hypothetical protein